MSTPVMIFMDWISSLPVEQRREIAAFACHFTPGINDRDISAIENPEAAFLAYVRAHESDKSKAVGMLLGLFAIVEVMFISRRGNRGDWEETQGMLAGMKQHPDQAGMDRLSEISERALRELPFRREQWVKTTEKWRAVRAASLSDESIMSWWQPW